MLGNVVYRGGRSGEAGVHIVFRSETTHNGMLMSPKHSGHVIPHADTSTPRINNLSLTLVTIIL